MPEFRDDMRTLKRDHPIFFWGITTVALVLLLATVAMAIRIPQYRAQAATLDARMSETERETRDRILNSQAKRSELAIALLQRELRLRALEEESIHLAISVSDSSLSLRHGDATLREVPLTIGPDSTVMGPDGHTWRLVQALGERHLVEKERNADLTVPDWVYHSRGEPIPPADQREVEDGLGSYLLRLDDGTEIHTRPASGPFATGARPAGFIVENESDMAAIFDAISIDTPVYIY
jgi:hypothetical protein